MDKHLDKQVFAVYIKVALRLHDDSFMTHYDTILDIGGLFLAIF